MSIRTVAIVVGAKGLLGVGDAGGPAPRLGNARILVSMLSQEWWDPVH